jgi:hypothetical protein
LVFSSTCDIAFNLFFFLLQKYYSTGEQERIFSVYNNIKVAYCSQHNNRTGRRIMHKRLMAMVAVLALGVATVLWVSANPQEKASVKPAVMKSGSPCCAKATMGAQTDKSQVKPAAAKESKGECPYMAGKANVAASNGKKDCSSCPEAKATLASKEGSKDCSGCPYMKSNGKASTAKAKPAPKATQAKATSAKKTANSL